MSEENVLGETGSSVGRMLAYHVLRLISHHYSDGAWSDMPGIQALERQRREDQAIFSFTASLKPTWDTQDLVLEKKNYGIFQEYR